MKKKIKNLERLEETPQVVPPNTGQTSSRLSVCVCVFVEYLTFKSNFKTGQRKCNLMHVSIYYAWEQRVVPILQLGTSITDKLRQ